MSDDEELCTLIRVSDCALEIFLEYQEEDDENGGNTGCQIRISPDGPGGEGVVALHYGEGATSFHTTEIEPHRFAEAIREACERARAGG